MGGYNSTKSWQGLLYLQSLRIHKCPFLFSHDNLIQVLSSQEVIIQSRWTPSRLVFLGTEARLHRRYVLKFSSISPLPASLAKRGAAPGLQLAPGRLGKAAEPEGSLGQLMFQASKEKSEPSPAHPPELGMTGVCHRDMSGTKQVKLTGTSAASYEEDESICIEKRKKYLRPFSGQ